MKYSIFLFALLLTFSSCTTQTDSEKLKEEMLKLDRRYKVDMVELASSTFQPDSTDGIGAKMGKGLGMLILSSMKFEFQFNGDGTGEMYLDAGLLGEFFNALGDDTASTVNKKPISYAFVGDSLLSVKFIDEEVEVPQFKIVSHNEAFSELKVAPLDSNGKVQDFAMRFLEMEVK